MLKKILLVCAMVFAMSTVAYGATEYISTEAELIALATKTSYDEDDTYKLNNDITINSSSWAGIGCNTNYNGTFDGDGYVVTLPKDSGAGLFANANCATIKNVTVEGNIVTESSSPVGGLVNYWKGAGIFATLFGTNNAASNCVSAVSVTNTGSGGVGGLIGNVEGTLDIIECAAIGEKLDGGSGTVGGLIGVWDKSNGWLEITDSYVVTTVETTSSNARGFVAESNSSFWINSSTNEATSYCCMYLDNGGTYSLVESLSPSGDNDEYCKIVSDPSVDKEDYDGYAESTWFYVASAFPRLVDSNPYNISQIMAAIVPIVNTTNHKISMRNAYGGVWSYNGTELVDGADIAVTSGSCITLELDGNTREYPILSAGTYEIEFINSRESIINSVIEYGKVSQYTYTILDEDNKSKFDNPVCDGVTLTCEADEDGFEASIDDSDVILEIDQSVTGKQAGEMLTGSVHFHDATTLAVGEIDFSVTVNSVGVLSVQFYDTDTYYCTTDVVPVNYDMISDYTGAVDITYYTTYDADNPENNKTTTSNGAVADGGAPSYAGTYDYVAVFAAADGYVETIKTGSYTIKKVTLTDTLKYSNSTAYNAADFVYDGEPVDEVKYTDLSGDLTDDLVYGEYYVLIEDEYVKTTTSNSGCKDGEGSAPVDAGSYMRKTTVEGDSNYVEGMQAVLFTITRATVNVTVEGDFFEYNGSKQTPTFTLNDDNAECDVDYYMSYEEGEYSDVVTTPKGIDIYWYDISLTDTDNFKLGMIQNEDGKVLSAKECYFEIGEVTTVGIAVSGTTISWTGEAVEIILSVTPSDVDLDDVVSGISYYAYDENGDVEAYPLNEVPTDVGTYQYVIKCESGYTVTFYDTDGEEIDNTGDFIITPQTWVVTVATDLAYEWDGNEKAGTYTLTDTAGNVADLPSGCVVYMLYLEGTTKLEDNPSQVGAYSYVCEVEDLAGNRNFSCGTDDTSVPVGTFSITDRTDWTQSLEFMQSVAYEMIDLGGGEGWKDEAGVIYRSGVPFFVSENISIVLTKIVY